MYKQICEEIVAILKDANWSEPIMDIHLPQRAKFEKYLQSALACRLKKIYSDTIIEYPIGGKLIDLYSNNTCIELKTPTTNYKISGITNKTRPITKNIASIIEDIQKLRVLSVKNGVVAFVLFPIDINKKNYLYYVNKIITALGHKNYCQSVINNMLVFSCKI